MILMAKPAKATASSSKKKTKAKPGKRTAPSQKEEAFMPKDIEDILLGNIVESEKFDSGEKLSLPTILYNSTVSLRELSYRCGFAVGKELYSRYNKQGILPLLKVLDSAGIGKVLYTPLEGMVLIRTATFPKRRIKTRTTQHSYEAGLISGYLSGHTSDLVTTRETHCMFNGSDFCQFSSSENVLKGQATQLTLDETVENAVLSIQKADNASDYRSESYTVLSLLPIMKEPILKEASKLMYLIGKRYAEAEMGKDLESSIGKISNFLNIHSFKLTKSNSGVTLYLRFAGSNSMEGFLELSTKTFIGFLSKRFNSTVRVKEGMFENRYTVTLTTLQGA